MRSFRTKNPRSSKINHKEKKPSLIERRLALIDEIQAIKNEISVENQEYKNVVAKVIKEREILFEDRLQDMERKLSDLNKNVFKTKEVKKLIEDTRKIIDEVRNTNYEKYIDFGGICKVLVTETVKNKMEYLDSILAVLAEKEREKKNLK
ncbi:hypothetical protein PVAND_008457 [Polypedilum vanderplanki]|uniref:Uncharacterized protein n=1 Tax=Polypedilum vanderplanki TaxID=319348 RepID=A0A9J6CA23_POLVA|nr:hypothetical protein PVAND_008457 [Polypedilum vanderplanki]